MENLIKYLVYKKNPLRQMGLIGLKALHLEADPVKNKLILERISKRFESQVQLTNAQRTLAQFLCQEALYSNCMQKMLSWLLFLFAIPMVVIFILIKSQKKQHAVSCDVFIFQLGDLDYVKADFKNANIQTVLPSEAAGNYLGKYELQFLFKTFRTNPGYFLHPRLLVNVLRWLSSYSWVLKYYNPNVIATFFEGTASCSLLTEYLYTKGVKHWNYAHGEHFRYDSYSSFANFDRYLIWGEHFKTIQVEKKCRPEMFETRAPLIFKQFYSVLRLLPKANKKQLTVLVHSGVEKGKTEYNYLLSLLKKLDLGWSVILRPHPVDRASWPGLLSDLKNDLAKSDKDIQIVAEFPENVPMKESVMNSRFFVGSASAALLEALLAGCKIIYLPGRIKNSDVVDRHRNSLNVFAFQNDMQDRKLFEFLNSEYIMNVQEELIINYLFDLN